MYLSFLSQYDSFKYRPIEFERQQQREEIVDEKKTKRKENSQGETRDVERGKCERQSRWKQFVVFSFQFLITFKGPRGPIDRLFFSLLLFFLSERKIEA